MGAEINLKNALALNEALMIERARVDALTIQVAGMGNALAALSAEVETMRKLVLVQRTSTGPSVKGGG